MDLNVFVAVVIYNLNCEKSKTCKGLLALQDIKVIVVDNSVSDYGNNNFCKKNGWQYISMGGNAGLSKAYNKVLDLLRDEKGILVLFDDDTEIPMNFFSNLTSDALTYPDYDIFLPTVYDEVGLLSPCKIRKFRIKRIKSVDEINISEISGINSGMAVKLSVFKDYRYDEKYFLDYIDHKFIRDMKNKGKNIKVSNTVINQRFFDNEKKNSANAKKRFKTFARDFKLFCNISFGGRIFCFFYLLFRALKLSLRYKNLSFFVSIF